VVLASSEIGIWFPNLKSWLGKVETEGGRMILSLVELEDMLARLKGRGDLGKFEIEKQEFWRSE